MAKIYGSVRLRPTRIGFLVQPSDASSLTRIMRWNTCLWGGRCNPIIPVGIFPECWNEGRLNRPEREVAREYMAFFEPDVVVEAEPGLATSIGYGALAEDRFNPHLLSLDDLHGSDEGRRPKLRFGLSVMDVYRHVYARERQFVLRDPRPTYLFNETSLSPIVEAVFGAFSLEEGAAYFCESYLRVFKPKIVDLTPEHWFDYFEKGGTTPFVPTHEGLDISPRHGRDLTFFVFDHTKPHDLIDYWNRRLFEMPVYPVPLCWASDLQEIIVKMVTENFRPIPHNPFGTMFTSQIHFARSLSQDAIREFWSTHLSACPADSIHPAGTWHPRVSRDRRVISDERHRIEANHTDVSAEIDDCSVSFPALAPEFAEQYGGGTARWANVVSLRTYGESEFAVTLPSNLENRCKPLLLRNPTAHPIITREGIVLLQEYARSGGHFTLMDGESAIAAWLKERRVEATLSGAGRIAKQMIRSLGGLWGVHLINDEETIQRLNRMAGQVVDGGETRASKQFPGRTELVSRWKTLINRRAKGSLPRLSLEDFPKSGVLKAGLGVKCPNCSHGNWFGLDELDYDVTCERCLKSFRFPQGSAEPNWLYRVIGPFSVPNYAEGAYAVTLTLNVFSHRLHGGHDVGMTYAAGLNLKYQDWIGEVDFAFWYGDRDLLGQSEEPRLVVGEAKSYAENAVKQNDLDVLRRVAEILPGSVLVVSAMKACFSEEEKALLSDFVRWSWGERGSPDRATVVLLTGIELFCDHWVELAWKNAGDPYTKEADFHIFNDLDQFALATQRIHLGLDRYAEHRTGALANPAEKKKRRRRASAADEAE